MGNAGSGAAALLNGSKCLTIASAVTRRWVPEPETFEARIN